jgi:diguanylate cyclase (GGDEF)-like protein
VPIKENELRSEVPAPGIYDSTGEKTQEIAAILSTANRRQWWLWSTSVMITILLTLGIASFAFPGLLDTSNDAAYAFGLGQAVRGLVGLVLVFNVYAIYQQFQIRRMQLTLGRQVFAMDKMEARTEEVYKLAMLDPLTGLYNRRSGEQRLATEMARTLRNGLPLSVIIVDVDNLKIINDQYGHAAGDEYLKYFSLRLNKSIRGSDVAVRIGGDEFLLILPECKPDEIRYVLGRLTGLAIAIEGHQIPVSFSAGWAHYTAGETSDELIKRADAALYINKRAGKEKSTPPIPANA